MSQPQNSTHRDFVKPSLEELAAQKKRNTAIGLSLAGFVCLIVITIVLKISALQT